MFIREKSLVRFYRMGFSWNRVQEKIVLKFVENINSVDYTLVSRVLIHNSTKILIILNWYPIGISYALVQIHLPDGFLSYIVILDIAGL